MCEGVSVSLHTQLHVHVGFAVLLCLVCLFDLACFFLSSLIYTHTRCIHYCLPFGSQYIEAPIPLKYTSLFLQSGCDCLSNEIHNTPNSTYMYMYIHTYQSAVSQPGTEVARSLPMEHPPL